jgi:hypothetical protein
LFKNKGTTWKQKFWAQKRGFLSRHISLFGLTEENYKNYLPYFDYYKLHPINGLYSHWIDDKLTMKLILHPFSENLPYYYFHMTGGEILKLMDCDDYFDQSINGIIHLLRNKKMLAGKLFAGQGGHGFEKLAYNNNHYYLNQKLVSKSELKYHLEDMSRVGRGGYLITEYLTANKNLSNIWQETPNSVRLMVIRGKKEQSKLVDSFIKFGTKNSGSIDNRSSGGIACKVDIHSGRFSDGKIIISNKSEACIYHPDTNILVEGVIPFWKDITKKIIEISNYLSQLIYIGYDIVVTDNGFKIIEMNSHQGIDFEQLNTPIFKNDQAAQFFKELLIRNSD